MSVLNKYTYLLPVLLGFFTILIACDSEEAGHNTEKNLQTEIPDICDTDNGGLTLPQGFCAGIVADNLGFIRHLSVNENGDIYIALRNRRLNLGGILALRDINNDGKMDQIEKVSDIPGIALSIQKEYLYFASDTDIYRFKLNTGSLIPVAPPDILVQDMPTQGLHAGKTFTIDNSGWIYVNIGADSNACEKDPEKGGPGLDPCPGLAKHAGIWKFSSDQLNRTMENGGSRYASGIRNAYAIDWHPNFNHLYVVQHGRDQLYEFWPDIYTAEAGARLPAEEFLLVRENAEYGWPYCYYDQIQEKRVLAPEYGGDGSKVGRCEKYPPPLIGFPAHYSPNDLKFYTARQFPEYYYNGAFIAFHGSYNRGEFEQVGYQVVFVPFNNDGEPSGDWEVFADGFAGSGNIVVPEDADYRPTGLAIGPDGSLYIADSVQGRVWRVVYTGDNSAVASDDFFPDWYGASCCENES